MDRIRNFHDGINQELAPTILQKKVRKAFW